MAESKDRIDHTSGHQTGEDRGAIERPQQTDATMSEKDLARGFQKASHARK